MQMACMTGKDMKRNGENDGSWQRSASCGSIVQITSLGRHKIVIA